MHTFHQIVPRNLSEQLCCSITNSWPLSSADRIELKTPVKIKLSGAAMFVGQFQNSLPLPSIPGQALQTVQQIMLKPLLKLAKTRYKEYVFSTHLALQCFRTYTESGSLCVCGFSASVRRPGVSKRHPAASTVVVQT